MTNTRGVLATHTEELSAVDCGCKASRLSRLVARGYAVPPFVVVPTSVYRIFAFDVMLRDTEALSFFQAVPSVDRLLDIEGQIIARCANARLPVHVEASLREWVRHRQGLFAVRSSATNEDLAVASFAGLYNSFLNVSADDVPRRVVSCFASLFCAKAVLYRRRKGIGNVGEMAVIVQSMITADHSGVVFSRAPRRPGNVLVECAPGLGDNVVSGTILPNRYYVSRTTLAIEDAIERRPMSHLTVRTAARTALSIEAAFGGAQDVEYATANDALYVLQARPASCEM